MRSECMLACLREIPVPRADAWTGHPYLSDVTRKALSASFGLDDYDFLLGQGRPATHEHTGVRSDVIARYDFPCFKCALDEGAHLRSLAPFRTRDHKCGFCKPIGRIEGITAKVTHMKGLHKSLQRPGANRFRPIDCQCPAPQVKVRSLLFGCDCTTEVISEVRRGA